MSRPWPQIAARLTAALAAGHPPPGVRIPGVKSAMQVTAEEEGVGYKTLAARVKHAERAGLWSWNGPVASEPAPVLPVLPDPEQDPADLWRHSERRFARLSAYEEARSSITIKMPGDLPAGILLTADTHLENPGTDLPLVRRHREICLETPGMYAMHLGDVLDNWPMGGRLAKLHAETPMTFREGRSLARYHFEQFGDKLLAFTSGNHDAWSADFIEWLGTFHNAITVKDDGRFRLIFGNEAEFTIHTRHSWPGTSQYNPAHGVGKAATFGNQADIIVGGHLHISGYQPVQHELTGRMTHAVQISGYKVIDTFAREKGFRKSNWMPAALAVLDPQTTDERRRVKIWWDIEEGAEHLTRRRAHYAGRR